MKFYTVYKKSNGSYEECVLVDSGFCWQNFLFMPLWALYKRIWDLVLIQLILISIAVALLNFYPDYITYTIVLVIAIHVLLSFYVNVFFKWKLIETGYEEIDFVAGCTKDEALLRFLSSSKKS